MTPLRQIFGPSRKEIWRQLSADLGGRYIEGRPFNTTKVQAEHGEWTVTLDTYAVSTGKVTIIYTRMRAPFMNPGGFRFTVYRRGLFSDIARWLGMSRISSGLIKSPCRSSAVIEAT